MSSCTTYSVIRIAGHRRNDNIGDWGSLEEAKTQALREYAYGTPCKVVDSGGHEHGHTGDYAPDGWLSEPAEEH